MNHGNLGWNPMGMFGKAVSAVSCFMFAMVQRTMLNAGGAWICAHLLS